MQYGVINFIYKKNSSWNCCRVCDTQEEFEEWVEMEKEYNEIIVNENIATVYINF